MAISRKTLTQGRQDINVPHTLGYQETPVCRPITALVDELERNINSLYEMTEIMEQNLNPVLRGPSPTESKVMVEVGDSLIGTQLCNFNFQLELLMDRLSNITSRINL